MATVTATTTSQHSMRLNSQPLLEAGDRLTREEFERRYEQMPGIKKAELIEGIVYMPSPVRAQKHGMPHHDVSGWIWHYLAATPGVACADNSTVRLDEDNEPQPDLVLFKRPEKGGSSRFSTDDYIEGSPELVVEIVGSSRAYDLHQKKGAYRRNGVREYLAWITNEERIVWWQLRNGEYEEIHPDDDGFLKSSFFPGLWLDSAALLRGDKKAVLAALERGLATPEHRAFAGA